MSAGICQSSAGGMASAGIAAGVGMAAEGLGKLGRASDLPALNAALAVETDDATRDRLAWAIERIDDDPS